MPRNPDQGKLIGVNYQRVEDFPSATFIDVKMLAEMQQLATKPGYQQTFRVEKKGGVLYAVTRLHGPSGQS